MDMEQLKEKLNRCLGCKVMPCAKACPLGVSPHDFIALAKTDSYAQAAQIIAAKNPLPQTCGLVCPDLFCQKACIRNRIDSAVEIPCLQAEVMQKGGLPPLNLPPLKEKSSTLHFTARGKFGEMTADVPQRRGAYIDVRDPTDVGLPSASQFTKFPRAAIIGGGPAGLGALFELITNGWTVDLYEKDSALGGAARLIPEYRLPKSVLDAEINRLVQNDRVTVHLNTEITDFESLKQQYDGVILAMGEPNLRTLGIKGEEHCISYKEFLQNPARYTARKIAVCGGGEVALDCALSAVGKVEMFVRRRREDMRIMKRDHKELDEKGITVRALTSITEINKKGDVCCLTTVTNEINAEGKAVHCRSTECTLEGYDLVIQALGSYFPKENIPEGFILAGDMTGASGTVVQALASGIAAARKLITPEE